MNLVTIIIPVYNVEKFIKRCLDSIISQIYNNIEIILVDDGSTDNSGKICDDYLKKDKRIKVIHKKNGGVSSARNFGIKKSTGKYLTFIDSDDYVSDTYISNLVLNIEKYGAVFGNAINFDDNGIISKKTNRKSFSCNKTTLIKKILEEKFINGTCWGNLYLSDYVKKIRFDENMKIAEDLKFVINYIDSLDDDTMYYITDYKDYFYYVRSDSTIHSKFNDNWFDEISYCKELILKYINTSLYDYAIQRYIRINLSCIENFKLNKTELEQIKNNIKRYKKKYLNSSKISLKRKIKLIYYILLK